MKSEQKVIRLHGSDNVAVALMDMQAGTKLQELEIELKNMVRRGHKIALTAINPGQNVIRYGQIIGMATGSIEPGEHVHTHNLGMSDHNLDYEFSSDIRPLEPGEGRDKFMGYLRKDGQVGTRNYLGILTSVNCSGSVARFYW